MARDPKLYLDDIYDSARKILEYTKSLSPEDFTKSDMVFDAVIRNFEIIGEASRSIPSDLKAKYPSIEWTKLAGFRNILIHEYFGIDRDILWDVISNHLPLLIREIQRILEQEP